MTKPACAALTRYSRCFGSLVVMVAMAACGGQLGSDGSDDGIGGALATRTAGQSESSGESLVVDTSDDRALISTSDGALVLWVRLMGEADVVAFEYAGQRYLYRASQNEQSLEPQGLAGTLVAGGAVSPGSQIGLPHYQISTAEQPHVLTFHGMSGNPLLVTYSVMACKSELCEPAPEPETRSVALDTSVAQAGPYALTFHVDTSQHASAAVAFALVRRDDELPPPAATTTPTPTPTPTPSVEPDPEPQPVVQPTPAAQPTPQPQPVPQQRDHNDGLSSFAWFLIAAGVIGGIAAIGLVSSPQWDGQYDSSCAGGVSSSGLPCQYPTNNYFIE